MKDDEDAFSSDRSSNSFTAISEYYEFMRLRRVKIFGFKTFADRAEFDLEGGLIAVVGANGCGKSNLVDAVLWGLGEGNTRQLRTQSGQDVIFNGSAKRKPVGFAEVQLTFDNEDGSLPIQASEVTISRRLTRGGESEYRLNRVVCRQRDIFELLADSGLGKSGYSIVGQRDIDAALSASPEDRRSWVDEAAGVQRYRQRRTEAQKRLLLAKDHLNRTIDILRELDVQREPLREEAELAMRYRELQMTFQGLDRAVLTRDFFVSENGLKVVELGLEQYRGELEAKANGQAARELKITEIRKELYATEGLIESTLRATHGHQSRIDRLANEIRLIEQKLESLSELEIDLQSDVDTMMQRIVEARAELALAESDLLQESEESSRLRSNDSAIETDRQVLLVQLNKIESLIKVAQSLASEGMRIQAENSHRQVRRKEIDREIEGIVQSESDLNEGITLAEQTYQLALNSLNEAREANNELEVKYAEIVDQEREYDTVHRKLLVTHASAVARSQAIASTVESAEGVSQGSKAVLDACARGDLKGDFQPVGLALRAKPETALAIEIALGGSVSDLIVSDETVAKHAVTYLKERRAGRATFQPLSLQRSQQISDELVRFLRESGVVGRAAELVECESSYKLIAESLLGRIVIVKSLNDAIRLSKGRLRPYNRLVTLEGEVIHASGAVTGGNSVRQTYGLVQRVAELESLQDEAERIRLELESREAKNRAIGQEKEQVLNQISEIKKLISERETTEREAKAYLMALRQEKESNDRTRVRLEKEKERLLPLEAPKAEGPSLEALELERTDILTKMASLNADAEQFAARLLEAETRTNRSRERAESARRRLHSAEETDENRKKRLEKIEPDQKRLKESKNQHILEKEIAHKDLAEEQLKLTLLSQQKEELVQSIDHLSLVLSAESEVIQALQISSHKLEIERMRLQSKITGIRERLAEEYGIFEDHIEQLDSGIEVPTDAEAILTQLKREMRAMGEVNLGAITAYERLTDRYSELEAQQQDISKGISDVEASIQELDSKTKDRFIHALNHAQVYFSNLFHRLFGGGEGHLVLTDSNDVLNSGLELDVTLPGKKRQPLALLSGGERSLCALAFLFALLEVKKSPLVVLDEVDAPLDGRNVDSFVKLLKDYSKSMQFIVITHNPTTIAAAPIWLGVTMQDPGCSTLIPYRSDQSAPQSDRAVVLA